MSPADVGATASAILKKAGQLGASLAGIALVEDLKRAPSFTFAPQLPGAGQVCWPIGAQSLVVIAVAHPADQPQLDWWLGPNDPPGNRILARVVGELARWIEATTPIQTVHLPYHVEKGGTYLKDAAVLAGLGCIGKNNILVTPQFGPRVRLRALTLDVALPATGPTGFDPCRQCDAPCRRACPQGAFARQVYDSRHYGQDRLPGRSGVFSRPACNIQMQADETGATAQQVDGFDTPVRVIRYCRACELACPVGA